MMKNKIINKIFLWITEIETGSQQSARLHINEIALKDPKK